MREECKNIAESRNVEIFFEPVSYTPPVNFHSECIDAIRSAAEELKLSHIDIFSGAGHDACHVSRVAPTGMIFVPCKNGISHNEKESAKSSDLAGGCQVLLNVMEEFAG